MEFQDKLNQAWAPNQKMTWLYLQPDHVQFRAAKAAMYQAINAMIWGHENSDMNSTTEKAYEFIQNESAFYSDYETAEHAIMEYITMTCTPPNSTDLRPEFIATRQHRYSIVLMSVAMEYISYIQATAAHFVRAQQMQDMAGVTVVNMEDTAVLHNTIEDALGE